MNFFQKKIFNIDPVSFGLDLSDLSVKVIQLERDGGYEQIVGFSSVPISQGAIYEGEVVKKDEVVSAIKKAVALAAPGKIRTKNVICSLPETKAFMRIVSVPQMDFEEIHEAVKWEMEANIPLPLDQVYYDWQVLENSLTGEKNKINLLVVAVAKNAVDNIIDVLQKTGLEVVGLEIESIAEARSLLDKNDDKTTTLIVDIGDRRTSFLIAKGGAPIFTSSVPISGQSITDAISKGMNVSFEEAERIKREHGIGSAHKNDSLFRIAEPVLENLAAEIERSIDFYLGGLGYSENIDKIVLCGGGANTKGVLPYLCKKTGKDFEMGDPWINLNLKRGQLLIDKNSSVQFATAIGLALRDLN